MSISIDRVIGRTGELNFTDTTTTSDSVNLGTSAGGIAYCTFTSTGAAVAVSWWGRPDDSATDYKFHADDNTPYTTTIQPGRCYEIPSGLFGVGQLKMTSNTAGVTFRMIFSLKG